MTKASLNLLTYVKLPQTDEQLVALDLAFAERRLHLISGFVGSGRHALYRYWLTGRWEGQAPPKDAVRPEEVLFVKLETPERSSMSGQRALIRAVRHSLDRRLRPAYMVARGMGSDALPLSTRSDIHKVIRSIRKDLGELKIKLLVLDNGDILDDDSLNQVLEFFLDYDDVYGTITRLRSILIIAATDKGQKNKVWTKIRANGDARAAALPAPIELDRLNVQSLPIAFSHLLKNNLGAELDRSGSDIVRKKQMREFLAEILRRTRGDWHNIPPVLKSLDLRLGQALEGKKRLLTKQVMDEVLSDLKQLSEQGVLERVEEQKSSPSDAGGAPIEGGNQK
ncbi:hypothetical protein K2Z83_24720 [Oscillochloris sp. ZM17-4]|uniref:hypothetical protein n=1 Tax=Oscillochloris sp. ZM17-4 TaxID=2866714 RepID=UPI001C72DDC7|nr:hypothetical protein [Oscillochloris sp. ZM17-4]MBX0330864.1 hypothetical protein [Oscillochloris sp. ZM17-4]